MQVMSAALEEQGLLLARMQQEQRGHATDIRSGASKQSATDAWSTAAKAKISAVETGVYPVRVRVCAPPGVPACDAAGVTP